MLSKNEFSDKIHAVANLLEWEIESVDSNHHDNCAYLNMNGVQICVRQGEKSSRNNDMLEVKTFEVVDALGKSYTDGMPQAIGISDKKSVEQIVKDLNKRVIAPVLNYLALNHLNTISSKLEEAKTVLGKLNSSIKIHEDFANSLSETGGNWQIEHIREFGSKAPVSKIVVEYSLFNGESFNQFTLSFGLSYDKMHTLCLFESRQIARELLSFIETTKGLTESKVELEDADRRPSVWFKTELDNEYVHEQFLETVLKTLQK